MRIGLIVTVINSERMTGIERYALELIRRIPTHLESSVVVLCSKDGLDVVKSTVGGEVKVLSSPFGNRVLTDQLWVPWITRRQNLDFVYNATLSYPFFGYGNSRFAMMVHDATPWKFPQTISRGMALYYLPQLKRALCSLKLSAIITNSKSSQQDIVQFCGIPTAKVHPIHLAIRSVDFVKDAPSELDQLDTLHRPYVLTVGTIEPRKNLQRAIEAFSLLVEEFTDLTLVIVGRRGWQKELPIDSSVKKRVVFTGYVSQDHLATIYSQASLFLFPSIYEGFGFPVLEAMVCGVPVVASNTSSLPEIGGEACVYVDPHSVEGIAQGMRKVLADSEVQRNLVELGRRQVTKFSWKETMNRTWQLLQTLTQS